VDHLLQWCENDSQFDVDMWIMHIALLFNSDAPKYKGSYGWPIKMKVLGTGIIQKSRRHMKMSVGDVLIYSNARDWDHYDELCQRVYFCHPWALLHEKRLRETFRTKTVYSLIFENMTQDIARDLHRKLTPDRSYLGLQAVEYAYGPHLALFRNSMISKYRLIGTSCRVFITMGEDDEKDEYELNNLKKIGFTDVDWEDQGAHKTIFDDYDTLEHFGQVARFREAIKQFMPNGEDDAYELTMTLEDLSPRLFNALGSAVDVLQRAQHEEHVAQAALSGRRYLESLADALFTARTEQYNGRKVGRAEYRNRLWAFIADNTSDESLLASLGAEVDRLIAEFNAALHGKQEKERILLALTASAKLTLSLFSLNPEKCRNPYVAFNKNIIDFWREIVMPSERP
jgi:hypothetical protein